MSNYGYLVMSSVNASYDNKIVIIGCRKTHRKVTMTVEELQELNRLIKENKSNERKSG